MKILIQGSALTIQFTGMERLWALKSEEPVEVADIVNVSWHKEHPPVGNFGGVRFPGTSLPFVLHAGSFWHRAGWDLRYIQFSHPGYLVIETKLHKYHKIQLTTDEASALKVVRWFNRERSILNFA